MLLCPGFPAADVCSGGFYRQHVCAALPQPGTFDSGRQNRQGSWRHRLRGLRVPAPRGIESGLPASLSDSTDFHIIQGEMAIPVDPFPILLGHEGAGEIVAVGRKVRNYQVGNRFINPPYRKTTDRYGATWGAMADYGVVQDQQAMREDGLSPCAFQYQVPCC